MVTRWYAPFLFSVSLLLSCEKVFDPETGSEDGSTRTFPLLRARVDGVLWNANGLPGGLPAEASLGGMNLIVFGTKYDSLTQSLEVIRIEVIGITTTGSYRMGVAPRDHGVAFYQRSDSKMFRTTEERIGRANVELFDKSTRRVAGTFEFIGEGSGGVLVSVSEGAFDVKW